MKLKLTIAFALLVIPIALAQPPVCDWRGYVSINGTLGSNAHVVTSYTNGSSATNGTIYSDGYYILHVPGINNDNITFKVCGVLAYPTNESTTLWSCGGVGYNTLNLSMHTLANGQSCEYACGCSGGFCCSGSCASSACSTTTTVATTSAPGGGGGGGAVATTAAATTAVTETTTTVEPPVTEEQVLEEIEAETVGTFVIENSDDLKVQEIEIEVKNTVSDVKVTVTKSVDKPASVAIAAEGETYAYLDIQKENIEDEDIASVTIKFKVEKSWIEENDIDRDTIILKRFVDDEWINLATVQTGEDDTYLYFEAVSPGLSVFAVVGVKKVVVTATVTTTKIPVVTTTTVPPVVEKKRPWFLIPIAIFLVVAVVVWLIDKRRAQKKFKYKHRPAR